MKRRREPYCWVGNNDNGVQVPVWNKTVFQFLRAQETEIARLRAEVETLKRPKLWVPRDVLSGADS